MKTLPAIAFARALACVATVAPIAAFACGICVDDRVAATYDHAVATQAAQRRHVVVFASMSANAEPASVVRAVRRAVSSVHGVDAGTVRTAAEPLGVSFALDPAAQPPERALAAIERGVGVPGFRLALLRVLRPDSKR